MCVLSFQRACAAESSAEAVPPRGLRFGIGFLRTAAAAERLWAPFGFVELLVRSRSKQATQRHVSRDPARNES
eukprot:1818770-Alexandrium_andersonii.AAC.1